MRNFRKIALFDTEDMHANLLPLSFTRPSCDFRVGITTLAEKWKAFLEGDYCILPVEYLRDKFSGCDELDGDTLFVAGNVIADRRIAEAVAALAPGSALVQDGALLAYRGDRSLLSSRRFSACVEYEGARVLNYTFDVFLNNPAVIAEDYFRLTAGRKSAPLPEGNLFIGEHEDEYGRPLIFIEEGASVEGAVINVKGGPVYIGRNAVVMEGACIRGPLALCENAKIRMGSRIYGGSTFGPYCKVGGEIDNTVMFGYSNKAHDGYLGNAVVGEWCNIGAGTNASNLKNDYSKIRVWNYAKHTFMRTDLQFCGPIIGDHTKIGINGMLNTATVLGVGVNIHGSGFPRVFVPSFSEGSASGGFSDVSMKKFYDIAERVMGRRGLSLADGDRLIYERVREVAAKFKG